MKKIVCGALVLMLSTILVAAPAVAADKSDIAGRVMTWEKEYNAGNLAAVRPCTPAMPAGCRPTRKRCRAVKPILGHLKWGKDQAWAKVKLAVTSAESSGDVAYGTGTYEITGADGSHIDHGKWMNVSKKSGGTWKIQCDIFNSDMPMPTGSKM